MKERSRGKGVLGTEGLFFANTEQSKVEGEDETFGASQVVEGMQRGNAEAWRKEG